MTDEIVETKSEDAAPAERLAKPVITTFFKPPLCARESALALSILQ